MDFMCDLEPFSNHICVLNIFSFVKDQLASNASKGGDCTFDQLGPKVVVSCSCSTVGG